MKTLYYFYTTTPDYFLQKLNSLGLKGEIIGFQVGPPVVVVIEVFCTEHEFKLI